MIKILKDKYISQVNWNRNANWNSTVNGSVTTVSTNGGPSYYGTYDQSGNVWELIDNPQNTEKILRGGSWSCGDLYTISSSYRKKISIYDTDLDVGVRLCTSSPDENDWTTWIKIGDPSNIPDDTLLGSYGSVTYDFYIQKYPVTNDEYAFFLNIVDPYGNNALELYSPLMGLEVQGGIIFNPFNKIGAKYICKPYMNNKPVVNINWIRAARLCNWLHQGIHTESTTENGVYEINQALTTKSIDGKFWIPLEDEWYKAAFFDAHKEENGAYWKYATQNDITPNPVTNVDFYGNGPCSVSSIIPESIIQPGLQPLFNDYITETLTDLLD